MKSRLLSALACAVLCSIASLSQPASAAILFDNTLDTSFGTAEFEAGFGTAQGVSFFKNAMITDFAFSGYLAEGGNAKFFVADQISLDTFLFQTTVRFGPSTSSSLLHSGPMSLSLEADHTYYFGIIANTAITLDERIRPKGAVKNGVNTLALSGQAQYSEYSSPVPGLKQATKKNAVYALQLEGEVPAIPEPVTWVMMLIGFAGVGFLAMRRTMPA